MITSIQTKLVLASLVLATIASSFATAADSADPYASETPAQRDARMEWWREARFGMFIHWGVYSVPAGVHKGKDVGDLGEWIMCFGKIPMADYQPYAKEFNPTKYDADEWVRLAKEAGMKYIVITAKHHDGFANFATQVNDWNIVKATPYGKDVLQPLAAACRKYGLKLGFYYSQAQDWNNGGSECVGRWDDAQKHDMDDYIDKVAVPQIRELLTNYGEFPAVIWWDTPCDMNKERADKIIDLLKLKPGVIHNNRLGGGYQGDTETPEQYVPATGFPGRDWETCMTLNDTWGFKTKDTNWKSNETILHNLVDIASKGGNYLLNVGPTSEGLIPQPSVECLKTVGAWMKVNGDSIYGTTASPFKKLPWGRCTKKVVGDETTLYLHVFNWPTNGELVVPGLQNKAESARLLATGKKLKVKQTKTGLVIKIPANAPDKISSTIVLKIKGTPEVADQLPEQAADGSVNLLAYDADLHGGLRYESSSEKDNIGFWTNPEDTASWTFKVTKPGKFKLTADLATQQETRFVITTGKSQVATAAPNTGNYTTFKTINLGDTLEIATSGSVTLTVTPIKENWGPINLKRLTLQPISQ